ncbi:PilT/PilU family type 4a pilus ATPase [Telmatocola sphagniphila]|uniref:PilT/PilU family type 4a pilus ATPase n=1 Tax=Telmatocola sphagniphila TaxID=1123043 RepID=A0A8E6ESP3_9BACT|nr:PilT/PilU family type 4a pilus ATPase [Telmatocola sphagniphila]QVL31084.1 PilT/PilU family type 4a pilus ATPase [Telmatocola sphagniphila]
MSAFTPINPEISAKLRDLLTRAVEAGASDLHLIAGYPPVMRLHGDLREFPGPILLEAETENLLKPLCPASVFDRLLESKNIDCSFEIDGNRFRANLFHSGGNLGACLRIVPTVIPEFEWAGFPEDLGHRIAYLLDGLVIVTGATGSGKTTSLAMIVNLLNRTGGYRIITVEEPIEYQYPKEPNSVITQREVGVDVHTFADGLKYGLRQDPDVILVGEIRDRETAQIALSAAETGHLVFSTMHTRDTKGAISRYADLFPQDVQRDVRYQLASSLRVVVAQRLLPDVEVGSKRHLAIEVLINTGPIPTAIRNSKLESIDNYLITNRNEGMLSFDESIRNLLNQGLISREVAESNVRELAILNR